MQYIIGSKILPMAMGLSKDILGKTVLVTRFNRLLVVGYAVFLRGLLGALVVGIPVAQVAVLASFVDGVDRPQQRLDVACVHGLCRQGGCGLQLAGPAEQAGAVGVERLFDGLGLAFALRITGAVAGPRGGAVG